MKMFFRITFKERKKNMDFSLTKEQEMLMKLAAQFAEEELEPVAAEIPGGKLRKDGSNRFYGNRSS